MGKISNVVHMTNPERIQILINAKETLRHQQKGICHAISLRTQIDPYDVLLLFPELVQFKPEEKNIYYENWFPFDQEGLQARQEIIDKTIKIIQDGKAKDD